MSAAALSGLEPIAAAAGGGEPIAATAAGERVQQLQALLEQVEQGPSVASLRLGPRCRPTMPARAELRDGQRLHSRPPPTPPSHG